MIGIDLVHIPGFAEQLGAPGSHFARKVFTPSELLVASSRGLVGDGPVGPGSVSGALARHLAGRWAAKEAFIKAWSQTLYGSPPPIERDRLDWREIEVVPDAYGRVALQLHGEVSRHFQATEENPAGQWRLGPCLSISHDGDYAVAVVRLE